MDLRDSSSWIFVFHTFIAAVRSIAAYIAVSLYVAIAAPIGMALAIAFRWKSLLYILGAIVVVSRKPISRKIALGHIGLVSGRIKFV